MKHWTTKLTAAFIFGVISLTGLCDGVATLVDRAAAQPADSDAPATDDDTEVNGEPDESPNSTSDDPRLSNLKIFNRVLLHLKDKYVQPERVDPGEIYIAATDQIESEFSDVGIDTKNTAAGLQSTVSVDDAQKELTFEATSLWECSFQLKALLQFIEKNRDVGQPRETEYRLISAVLETIDDAAALHPQTEYEQLQKSAAYGVGLRTEREDERILVKSVVDGTPASSASIHRGDELITVDGHDTDDLTDVELRRLLGQSPGEEVTLKYRSESAAEPETLTLQSAVSSSADVSGRLLADGVGYIEINKFRDETPENFVEQYQTLESKSDKWRGLILDLRGNSGGIVKSITDTADVFVESGLLLKVSSSNGDINDETRASSSSDFRPDVPVLLLVDRGTSSGAEAFASALKTHGRALVIGERTDGRALVQVLYEFDDGSALRLPIAEMIGADGDPIDHGITPHLPEDVAGPNVGLSADTFDRLFDEACDSGDLAVCSLR